MKKQSKPPLTADRTTWWKKQTL